MADSLRLIFAGTPDFAAIVLDALLGSPHQLCAVYTQPDRPAGRGRKLTASPVKRLAVDHGIPVFQPVSLRAAAEQQQLAAWQADIMVVVAYGLILPQNILSTPRLGCINVHASLLPRWRGAAPIQRAIQAGDRETGITIMQMNAGLDTGNMLLRSACPILADDTAASLHDRLAELGAKLLLQVLAQLAAGDVTAEAQNEALACYAQKLNKAEAEIDWQQPAVVLERQIRAFNPWPVAYTTLADGRRLRVWLAQCLSEYLTTDARSTAMPGQIIGLTKDGIDVVTGAGVLRLLQVQLPGGKAVAASAVVNAAGLSAGARLGDWFVQE